MTINTNPAASSAALQLSRSQDMLTRSLNKLSSGSRIVQPSDDAAGLAVSEKFSAQGKRINAALTNVQNAVSYVQTADGFMGGLSQVLSRMSELSMLSKDVTKNTEDIALYQKEFTALQQQVIEAQRATLRELSTPLIPLAEGVLVMPLIGTVIDTLAALGFAGSSVSDPVTLPKMPQ